MFKRKPSRRREYYYDFSGIIPRKRYRYVQVKPKVSIARRFLPFYVLVGSIGFCFGLDVGFDVRVDRIVFANQESEVEVQQDVPVREAWEHGPIEEHTRELPLQEYPEVEKTNDQHVGDAVDYFFESAQQRSEARMIMHCLLHIESSHGANKGHGDNGMAGGILQFWEETWAGYRKIMINEGYTEAISSRYNEKDAIYTTVWALKTNRGKAWGPIYRELTNYKYSDKPGCPVPSWSKDVWK